MELVEKGLLKLLIEWGPKLFRFDVEELIIANYLNLI